MIKTIWKTLYAWRELWFWPLFALVQWWALNRIAAGSSGRTPQENLDFLSGLGANILIVVLGISLVSILQESTGFWWTKDELKTNPQILWPSAILRLGSFLGILWVLTH